MARSTRKPRVSTKTTARRASRIKRAPAYSALVLSQNAHRFYFGTIPVKDLFDYCFVSRREEDASLGFQRSLNERRSQDIAEYLASGNGSIPTNIVLSAQKSSRFKYNPATKSIAYDRVERAFLVLDGQHRLWGYHKCRKPHRVPVAIYEGLTRAQEAKLFIDINTNQRGVPAALLLDIKQVAEIESAKEQMLRDLFDQLGTHPRSPLAGRLSPSKSVTGKVSRVSFNRAVGRPLMSSTLGQMEAEDQLRLILNYLNAFDAELDEKKNLTTSAFFQGIFEVFEEVVQATLGKHGDVKQDSLQQVVRPLAKLDLSSATGGRTRVSKAGVAELMKATLRQSAPISTDQL